MMERPLTVLAIETSCDETAAALVRGRTVLSNVLHSQSIHRPYGGVVPELASRAHLQLIVPVVRQALVEAGCTMDDVDAIAVTAQPGLIGSLLVGVNFAKGLALRYRLPVVPINHLEGHIFSGLLEEPELGFPFLALVVSGGHTALFWVESFQHVRLLGSTRDDAAGEAFDKVASLLGLGYPGGPAIDRLAAKGNPAAFALPRALLQDATFDFSFSGLKTAVRSLLQKRFPKGPPEEILPDICASVQAAIVEVLVQKTIRAAQLYHAPAIVVAGGVSANSALRRQIQEATARLGIRVVLPRISYCLDNAAMIGLVAHEKLRFGGIHRFQRLIVTASPTPLRASPKSTAKSRVKETCETTLSA
ncbi:MAG: tRNA (adenosine(37)-N6)-threonylcarbamoyltransferase complex transferase subunit TsaD [Bacteroidota bacterium]|nr:tRNA (adenosine(37)-N6)-threonylcarbamoyltransferase complex transferase subunit TsaD [Bacteroidota bacterium]